MFCFISETHIKLTLKLDYSKLDVSIFEEVDMQRQEITDLNGKYKLLTFFQNNKKTLKIEN